MLKKNQKGFGAVEGLLILVIVGLVGFIGWYVYHTKNNANSSYNNAAIISTVNKVAPAKAIGTHVDTKDKKVQFNLDTNWVVAQRDDTASGCGVQVSTDAGSCVSSIWVQPKDFKGKQASWTVQVFSGQTKMGKDWPGGETECTLTDQSTQSINGYSAFSAKTNDVGCTASNFYLVWNNKYIVLFSSFDNSQAASFNKIVNSVQFLY